MGRIMYATREDVRRAIDASGSSRDNAEIDRALLAATEKINGQLRRDFAPTTATRYFDWPNLDGSVFRVYVDDDAQAISLTALSSGGVSIDMAQVNLESSLGGAPYDTIEVNRDTVGSWTSGITFQRSIAATGVWGYDLVEEAAGTLPGTLNAGDTQLLLADAVTLGVGSLVRVDSERMVITDKVNASTGITGFTALADEDADRLFTVPDGTQFRIGEVITLDAERCEVQDILGNVLVLRRAVQASVLSTHAAGLIYSPRLATVARGQLGTSAASHSGGATLNRHVFPWLIQQYAIAEALIELQLQASSYARTRPAVSGATSGRGVAIAEAGPTDIRDQAVSAHGRYGRHRAI